jgi:hypothetical protein
MTTPDPYTYVASVIEKLDRSIPLEKLRPEDPEVTAKVVEPLESALRDLPSLPDSHHGQRARCAVCCSRSAQGIVGSA